jgi:hypothetical protein
MAESKKTKRGTNFVKNFGRAKSDLKGILEWCQDHRNVDTFIGGKLSTFFNDQAGVDKRLKFWHVHHKQFPKYNERMWWETKDALARYRDNAFDQPMCYPGDAEEPSGGADPYLQKDPLTADKMVIPFRIIHTRELEPEECAEAALAFIDHDDFLGDNFKWDTPNPPHDTWDGDLLGIESVNTDETMEKIKQRWFVPTNSAGDHFDPAQGMITVVSDSVVRTINWYLRKIDCHSEFKVHRLKDIKDQFRSPGWQVKPSLKSYRLEWPTIRNLEEASEITDNTLTGCIENLVNKHLGNEVTRHINEKIQAEEVKLGEWGRSGDPEDQDTYDMEDVWDQWTTRFDRYRDAVAPLGNKVPRKLGEQSSEELLEIANKRLAKLGRDNEEMVPLLEKVMDEVKKNAPHKREKGGNTIASGFGHPDEPTTTDITRTYKETDEVIEILGRLPMVMMYAIPFTKAKPQIFTKIEGGFQTKGKAAVRPTGDMMAYTFIGYEQVVEDEKQTWESLAKIAYDIAMNYEQFYSPNGMGITPEQIMWASGASWDRKSSIIEKGKKIVCPDPRTLPAHLLWRLNPKEKAE